MKRFFLSLLAFMTLLTAGLLAPSCEGHHPVDVVITDYEYEFTLDDIHLSDGEPAFCDISLAKGGTREEKVYINYKVDDDLALRVRYQGMEMSPGASVTFDATGMVRLVMPVLPEGRHVLHLVITNQYKKSFEADVPFQVIRDKVWATAVEAPSIVKLEAGVPVDTVVRIIPEDADIDEVAYICSDPEVVLVGVSGEGHEKVLHFDPLKEGYATVDLYHADLGEEPCATVRVEVFSYRIAGMPEEIEISEGGSKTIQLSVRPSTPIDLYVAGTSCTASAAGSNQWVIQAREEGTAVITATAGNSVAQCNVVVGRKPETVTVSPMAVSIDYGRTRVFTVTTSGGYNVEMRGEGATIVERSANSITVRNDNRLFEDAAAVMVLYNAVDNTKTAQAEILLQRRPETVMLTEMSSGNGQSVWLVGGENKGWTVARKPAGVNAAIEGSFITLTNEAYKSASGTLAVRTNDQGVEASSSVVVPGKEVVMTDLQAIPGSFNEEVGRSIAVVLEASYSDGTVKDVTNSATWTQSSNLQRSGNSFVANAVGEAWVRASFSGRSVRVEGVITPRAVTVKAVKVEPATWSALVGENKIFTATATFSDNSSIDVTKDSDWSVTGPASSIGRGYYHIGAAGEVLVTATYSHNGSTASGVSRGVASKPTASVTGVAVSPLRDSVQIGSMVNITGTVEYSDGTEAHNGSFSVSPADILAGSGGVYTAVKAGTAVVTYTYSGWSASSVIFVTQYNPGPDPNVPAGKTVGSFTVEPSTLHIEVGDRGNLSGNAVYTDGTSETIIGNATWMTSDASVATVDEYGRVFGLSVGSAVVTGYYGQKSSMCLVTVAPPVTVSSLTVEPSSIELVAGEGEVSLRVTAKMSDQTVRDVTSLCNWSSSMPQVASVDGGLVKALSKGRVTVSASYGGRLATCAVSVKDPVMVTALAMDPSSMELTIGQGNGDIKVTAYFNDGTKSDVTQRCAWSSENSGVALVAGGVVTPVAAGSTRVKATYAGQDGYCSVTVKKLDQSVDRIELNRNSVTLTVGQTFQIDGKVYCINPTREYSVKSVCTFYSSNAYVASVKESYGGGLVTAVSPGTATITVKNSAPGNNTAEFRVTVLAAPVEKKGIMLNPSSATVMAGEKYNLSANVKTYWLMSDGSQGEEIRATDVRWSEKSSYSQYATLSGGVVTVKETAPTTSLYYIAKYQNYAEEFQLNVSEKEVEPYFTPTVSQVEWAADDMSSKDVSFDSNVDWRVTVDGPFTISSSSTSGRNSGKVSVRPSGKNETTAPKTGTLKFTYAGSGNVSVRLVQNAPGTKTKDEYSLAVEPSTYEMECRGYKVFAAKYYKTTYTSSDGGKTWTPGSKVLDSDVTTKAKWSVTEGGQYAAFGSASGRLEGKNDTFTDQTVRIKAEYAGCTAEAVGTVKASAPFVDVTPGSVSFSAKAKTDGEKQVVKVTSNTPWSVRGDVRFDVTPLNGGSSDGSTTETNITITAKDDNFSKDIVTGKVTVEYKDGSNMTKTKEISVSQANVTNTRILVEVKPDHIAADGTVQAYAKKQESVSNTEWKTVEDVTQSAKWFISESQSYATIGVNGLVTGTNKTAQEHDVVIWASYGGKESDRVKVTVGAFSAEMDYETADGKDLVWAWDAYGAKTVTVTSNVTWTANAPEGFTVSPTRGVAGTTTMTVSPVGTNENGASGDIVLTNNEFGKTLEIPVVQNARQIQSLIVSPSSVTIGAGLQEKLTCTATDGSGNSFTPSVTWKTNDTNGIIDAAALKNGIVKGLKAGKVQVWAEYGGASSNRVSVDVFVAVTGLELSTSMLRLERKAETSFSVTVKPESATYTDVQVRNYPSQDLAVRKIQKNGNTTVYGIVNNALGGYLSTCGNMVLGFNGGRNGEELAFLYCYLPYTEYDKFRVSFPVDANVSFSLARDRTLSLNGLLSFKTEHNLPGGSIDKPVKESFGMNSNVFEVYHNDNWKYTVYYPIRTFSDNPEVAEVEFFNNQWTIVSKKPGIALVSFYVDYTTCEVSIYDEYFDFTVNHKGTGRCYCGTIIVTVTE